VERILQWFVGGLQFWISHGRQSRRIRFPFCQSLQHPPATEAQQITGTPELSLTAR